MKPGKLAYVVTVQRFAGTGPNDFGTEGGAWQHLATMRAEVVTLTTAEAMAARGAGDETDVIFRVRDLVEIRTSDRLAFRSRWHTIKDVRPVEGAALELHCVSAKA